MHSIVFHLILLAYLFAALFFWLHLSLRQRPLWRAAQGLVAAGVLLHSGWLALSVVRQGTLPPLSLLSWAIAVAYVLSWWRYRIEALGSFVVPLAFLAAAVPAATPEPWTPVFQQLWLSMHVFLAILGYAALSLAFGAGLMYLLQERQLKSRRPGQLSERLPSLTLLDELNARALRIGFPLLTQGIITGSVWAKHLHGSYLYWSLKSLPLLLAWLLYALLLGGRRRLGWQGRKAASAAVGGFPIVLASYFVHTA
ncbi:MAG: c-type cytochrome biogenesis protein CcsB [Candidatus Tectimicrobiota bacterium]|nr:MAG: c-type cytochrome biogenesis protein CcsB [Candidatus Tectomicrobia bacterium]